MRSCFGTILYPRALAASSLPLLGELSGYEIAYGDTVLVKLGSHFCSEVHLAISQQGFSFESGSEELHGHEDQMLDTSNRLEQSA